MGDTETATLLVYLLMMFLAPSPFVAVLERSDRVELQASKLRATLASSVTGKQLWDGGTLPSVSALQCAGGYLCRCVKARRPATDGVCCVLVLLCCPAGADMFDVPGFDVPSATPEANERFVGRVLTAMLTIGTVAETSSPDPAADPAASDLEGGGACKHELMDDSWEHDVDSRLLLLVKYPVSSLPPSPNQWRRHRVGGGAAVAEWCGVCRLRARRSVPNLRPRQRRFGTTSGRCGPSCRPRAQSETASFCGRCGF